MSFYSSGQQRLAINTRERRMEQANGDKQQARVYAKIAADQGDIEMADRYTKIGMSIVGNIAKTEVPIANKQGGVVRQTVLEHVKSMIEAGTLSNWWDAIKRIPAKKLSPKARVVQDDIKHNAELKAIINEKLTQAYIRKQEGIIIDGLIQETLDVLTGGDKEVERELDGTASQFLGSAHGSEESLNTTTQGTVGKALKVEQDLSGTNVRQNELPVGEIQDRIRAFISNPPSKSVWNDLSMRKRFMDALTPDLIEQILSNDSIVKELTDSRTGKRGKVLIKILRKKDDLKASTSTMPSSAGRFVIERAPYRSMGIFI